jgi:hypothetical protein
MDLTELNNEFDILFEDLATAGSKGLDEYEKSVCFTYAQEQVVKGLAEQQNLIPITSLVKINQEITSTPSKYKTGKNYPIVTDSLVNLGYFASSADKDIPADVVPQQVITNLLLAPYQYPPKNLVYVVVGEDTNIVFLPLNFQATSFNTRYVEYPTPVILDTLTGGLSINGLTVPTDPVLDESFHRMLVNAAVQYAISVYIGQQEKEVPDNQRQ